MTGSFYILFLKPDAVCPGSVLTLVVRCRIIAPPLFRTANSVQTTTFSGVKRGDCRDAVDAGFPLQYDDFPLVRAVSYSWIEQLTANCFGALVYPIVF